MPTPFIKNLAKETDKTEDELEKYWDEGIKQAEEKGLPDGPKQAYATAIVKKRAGVKDDKKEESFIKFIESKLSAKEYLE